MNTPEIFHVSHYGSEFPGAFTLRLTPTRQAAAQSFQPGQFNMLYLFGSGEVAISLSGDPTTDKPQEYVHTVRALGSVTHALERLREGDQVGVRGPFGQGWPVAEAAGREVLIIAGGLGLAPLRPLIYALLAEGAAAKMQLFYGARAPREMLYRRELEAWSRQFRVATTVDSAGDDWHGNIGVVTTLLAATTIASDAIAFVCGPEIMMRFSLQELLKQNLPPTAIYLSMERNMKCATGHCGHCQWGPHFICKDGPVFCYGDIQQWLPIRQL